MDVNSHLPLQFFESGQLLLLSTQQKAGLILQQPHFADFVGMGGAVGGNFDVKSVMVYPIGKVEFVVPDTYEQKRQAFQRRIAYMNSLHKITAVDAPLQRAFLIVRQLSLWVGQPEAQTIPLELVAQLVGVLPESVAIAWQQYRRCSANGSCETLIQPGSRASAPASKAPAKPQISVKA